MTLFQSTFLKIKITHFYDRGVLFQPLTLINISGCFLEIDDFFSIRRNFLVKSTFKNQNQTHFLDHRSFFMVNATFLIPYKKLTTTISTPLSKKNQKTKSTTPHFLFSILYNPSLTYKYIHSLIKRLQSFIRGWSVCIYVYS